MNKKSFLLFLAMAVLAGFFSSCKDEFTEKDAMLLEKELNDSLLRAGGIIKYSVSIVSVGNGGVNKSLDATQGVAGAIVTVSQNGVVVKDTTDESGIVAFNDMRIGNVSVNVVLADHATIDYIADLTPTTNTNINTTDMTHVVRTAATLVPMFPTSGNSMATIQGKATYQSDLTNDTYEYPAGAVVTVSIDVNSDDFKNKFIKPFGGAQTPNVDMAGRIIKMSFSNIVNTATIGSDGTYTLQIPATANGLPVKVNVSDVVANQTVLMHTVGNNDVFGAQSIRTIFGLDITPSTIPNVAPAYVLISAPQGYTYSGSGFINATATATVDNTNGISSVYVTTPGAGYATPGASGYYNAMIKQGDNESALARLYTNNGRIIRAEVASPGANYSNNATINLAWEIEGIIATANVNGSGTITSVTVTNGGLYRVKPTRASISGGNNAVLEPNWDWSGANNAWTVSSISVINGGDGYPTNAIVRINVPNGFQQASASLNLTTGKVKSINVTNTGAGYYATPEVVINGGGGSGAKATAHRDANTNKIDYITITDEGDGYSSNPTVTIVPKEILVQAKISLTVNTLGIVTGATIDNAGDGYYSMPTIEVKSAVEGIGSGAQIIASLDGAGKLANPVVVRGGTGYKGKNFGTTGTGTGTVNGESSSLVYDGETTINLFSGVTKVIDIKLGSGKREIEN